MEYFNSAYEKASSYASSYVYGSQPVTTATMGWKDWALVLVGVTAGMGLVFGGLFFSAGKDERLKGRVLTKTNVWLVLSGVIHLWIEGSFVFQRQTSVIKAGLDYYAAGDFRYGSPMEAGTAAMEAITSVLEGPLCWAVAYGAIHGKAWRFPWQLVLCTAQIYGLIWFVLQPVFHPAGFKGHLNMEDPFFFWFIVVGMNAPWAVFPVALWWEAYTAIVSALGGAPAKPARSSSADNGGGSAVQETPASLIKRRSRRQS